MFKYLSFILSSNYIEVETNTNEKNDLLNLNFNDLNFPYFLE